MDHSSRPPVFLRSRTRDAGVRERRRLAPWKERGPKLAPSLVATLQPAQSFDLRITFGFHCNLACTFCLVEDGLEGRFRGVTLDDAERTLADPRMAGARRIIFSGGEVTLEKDLPRYVELARRLTRAEHVRIETNATRLGDRALLDSLLEVGIDEFFVSLHGHDAETCDAITQNPGSFQEILRGIENISQSTGTLITNTCVVRQNYRHLRDLIALVAPYGPASMEFWNYIPRVDRHDERDQLVPIQEVMPNLLEALRDCRRRSIGSVVKYFPRCLLGEFAELQANGQGTSLIDDEYWLGSPDYSCIFQGVCSQASLGCWGLAHAYISRFGWAEEVLEPSFGSESAPPREPVDLLQRFGMSVGERFESWTLADAVTEPGGARFGFGANGRRVEIRIAPTDLTRPCYARSANFDMVHSKLTADEETAARRLLDAFARRVQLGDHAGTP